MKRYKLEFEYVSPYDGTWTAHIWKKSTERCRALLATLEPCEECNHPWSFHADEYGCEFEPGDRDGVALPPCGCQRKPGDEFNGLAERVNELEAQLAAAVAALEPFANYAKTLERALVPATAVVRYDPSKLLSDKEPIVGDFLTAADALDAARAKGETDGS
jgi:hypothetical protein